MCPFGPLFPPIDRRRVPPPETEVRRRRRPAGLWAAPLQRSHMTTHRAKRCKIAARGTTMTGRKGSPSPSVDGADSGQISRDPPPAPSLPEDIWHHIHSLMPMRDAARAACISGSFLHSWRHRPSLSLALGMVCPKGRLCPKPQHRRNFRYIIDRIMKNHSGIGLKIFKLYLAKEASMLPYIDVWLQIALAPGIQELFLSLWQEHSFPCSLLSDGVRNSIQNLHLSNIAFHPTAELGPLRSLTSLCLCSVGITGCELECLLSNSPALEKLDLYDCNEISFLKIPCVLLQELRVTSCRKLQLIEGRSPNLCSVDVYGPMIRLTEALQVKYLYLANSDALCYAFSELPSIMPNLETLKLYSRIKEMDTSMLPAAKLLHLRHLVINIGHGPSPPSYDYLSLAALFDASPSLETLFLDVSQDKMDHESALGGSSDLRQLPEHRYGCLRKVEIRGFSSAKSLVELTCCIVKNAASLECLVLDTLHGGNMCRRGNIIKTCRPISEDVRKESSRAVMAIRKYIKNEVPPTVKFSIVEPCSRCHAPRSLRRSQHQC